MFNILLLYVKHRMHIKTCASDVLFVYFSQVLTVV